MLRPLWASLILGLRARDWDALRSRARHRNPGTGPGRLVRCSPGKLARCPRALGRMEATPCRLSEVDSGWAAVGVTAVSPHQGEETTTETQVMAHTTVLPVVASAEGEVLSVHTEAVVLSVHQEAAVLSVRPEVAPPAAVAPVGACLRSCLSLCLRRTRRK